MLTLGLALHLHHHFHGAAVDYLGLAIGCFASWVGVPGPGEPLLIATAVLAARNHLDITQVIVVAWLAATFGGIIGWLIGLKAGRAVLTTRGPLHRMRLRALEHGEKVFQRYAALAIILTPTWVAGIHGVPLSVYMIWNAVGAALWAAGIGLAAYYIGPPVIDAVSDLGWITPTVAVGLVLILVAAELFRRRRRRQRSQTRPGEARPK